MGQKIKPSPDFMSVTIKPKTLEVLQQIAEDTGEPVEEVLDHAVEVYRRREFLMGLNADFEALKKDPDAWEEELRERKLWERTLSDGLQEP